MDTSKKYVGKVVKVQFTSCGKETSRTGIVYQQENTQTSTKLSMILTNGAEWTPSFKNTEDVKISSVRIDKELRAALEKVCDAKIKHKAFLDKFWEEKRFHENNVADSLKTLKECSGEMTRDAFMEEVESMFREKYPATGGFHSRRYFSWDSVGDKAFSVCQTQEIEKYIQPESYSFICREYDGCLFINSSAKGYKEFCERNAPPILPELKDKAKISVSASLGDKNFLLAHRSYEFPLREGFTKKELQRIRDFLYPSRKTSLEDRINDAKAKSAPKETGARTPVKDNLTK